MTWTARKQRQDRPGQFRDFPISVQIPGKAGDTLTFKALQTYSNGEVVRWIGATDADARAAGDGDRRGGADAGALAQSPRRRGRRGPTTRTPAARGSKGLRIAALIVGGLGLVIGGGALAMSRRRNGGSDRRSPATA